MERLKYLSDIDVKGKRVLIALDIPSIGNLGKDSYEAQRLKQSFSSVSQLLKDGASVVILPHSRAKVADNPLSLAQSIRSFSSLLGSDISFFPNLGNPDNDQAIKTIKPGQVAMLENLFMFPGEESNDPSFAVYLSQFGEIFVNDAFESSAMPYASMQNLPSLFQVKAAGLNIENEYKAFEALIFKTKRPLLCIFGGLKFSSKIDLMFSLAQRADKMIITGGLANTFLAAQGLQVGRSVFEKDLIGRALELLGILARRDCKVYLPVDFIVAPSLGAAAFARPVPSLEIPADTMALDIGPASIALFQEVIKYSDSTFWYGSAGASETEEFSKGSQSIVEAVSASTGYKVACGKSVERAIAELELSHKFDLISSSSSSFTVLCQGRTLSGLRALSEK
ncbi:MAG: phosphoglycerate kinase [SAR324 cluster bacterium]|uniref:Phosphoglycerate kinase n=1 Tax=SAR324 cluster bacterium TaxID=2024889 RepID=A0A7X9IJG5_9DELT|nr:phosphoglycerate kinase [SAR324 cluster bacterium]